MPGSETQWVYDHAPQMDRRLRRAVLESYRPPRWLPWRIARFVAAWRQKRVRLPVIIQLHKRCTADDCRSMLTALKELGCRDSRPLELITSVATRVPVASLEVLLRDARVAKVALDHPVAALAATAPSTVSAPQLWREKLSGEGVAVAILDTGIHPHTDLTTPTNRIVGFKDFVRNRRDPYDDHGHGTHTAGVVAGNGAKSEGKYRGVAPGANLVGVKVLNAYGMGSTSTAIQGIQWVVEHREQLAIRILNVSLGAPAVDSFRDDLLAQAVDAAWESGLVVCVAAGNDGPGARSIATPGTHPRVVTVGASDDKGTPKRDDDTVPPFSSRGPTLDDMAKPDLVAPGVNVTAANAFGSTFARSDYITLTGSSVAAAALSRSCWSGIRL